MSNDVTKVFEWDFSAYGAAGYGVRVFAEPNDKGGFTYQAHFAKGWPNKDNTYICDADSASLLIRVAVDRFATWCREASDADVALFAGALSDKVRHFIEGEGF